MTLPSTETYSSIFTVAFTVKHRNQDASDLTADDFRRALLQRIDDIIVEFGDNADDWWNAVGPPEDTCEDQ